MSMTAIVVHGVKYAIYRPDPTRIQTVYPQPWPGSNSCWLPLATGRQILRISTASCMEMDSGSCLSIAIDAALADPDYPWDGSRPMRLSMDSATGLWWARVGVPTNPCHEIKLTVNIPGKKTCDCGAGKIGVPDFKVGHSSWCSVAG